MLEGQSALAQKLLTLKLQRSNIFSKIQALINIIPSNEEIKALEEAEKAYQDSFISAFETLDKQYTKITVDVLKQVVDLAGSRSGVDQIQKSTYARIFGDQELLDQSAQENLINAASNVTKATLAYLEANNKKQFEVILAPLKQQLENIDTDIAELKEKIAISGVLTPASSDSNASVMSNDTQNYFSQIVISSTLAEVMSSNSHYSHASPSNYGGSFFFWGYSRSSSHSEVIDKMSKDTNSLTFDIGLSVAKVSIERDWFNPGVFLLSDDMFNTSHKLISPNQTYDSFTQQRFDDMNQCIFPSFPTSFLIAKDVSIKFTTSSEHSSQFASMVEDHTSKGGGFFCFKGSSSSSTVSSTFKSEDKSSSTTVSVRFINPQIIGYYMEATPKDQSAYINDTSIREDDSTSIVKFVEKFQEMLEGYNEKYHKTTLQL